MRVLGLCNFSLDRDHVSYQLMFSLNVANAGTNKYLVLAWLTREYHKPIINHNKIPMNFEYKILWTTNSIPNRVILGINNICIHNYVYIIVYIQST